MSRFTVIDPDHLPAMQVLETISSEDILSARMTKLVDLWKGYDPPNGALYDVQGLEFDPIKINQEASTYFETMLRDRVNQACRAITLAYAVGSDLDAVASRYPAGCPRLPIVAEPRGLVGDYPEDYEDDERYRRRVWLSPNTWAAHGVEEAYEFWALTADTTLRDVSAIKIRHRIIDDPIVVVTCLADDDDPKPTDAALTLIREYIRDEGRQGLTDEVSVRAPKVANTDYHVRFKLFPGPDPTILKAAITAALDALIEKQRWLGYDHTRMAITAAAALDGVANLEIIKPAQDVTADEDWFVKVNTVTVEYTGRTE